MTSNGRTSPRTTAPQPTPSGSARVTVTLATDEDRHTIYSLRHSIYACELQQHAPNASGSLQDDLDAHNLYLVAKIGPEIAGFISVTPPDCPSCSIDKYFPRSTLPISFEAGLHEVRLLTVRRKHRGRDLAVLLMYAAFRWVESNGGKHIVALGRDEILNFYLATGLKQTGFSVKAGAVKYHLLQATTAALGSRMHDYSAVLDRVEGKVLWQLGFSFRRPASCYHGGAFFSAIGETFKTLERSETVINADVLDAWFPPSPRALETIRKYLPWLLRTSPPTDCRGLIESIAETRGVAPDNILPGAGSSDLMFRALRAWLRPGSRALILDPSYGEYAHLLGQVIDCDLDRFMLGRDADYGIDLDRLAETLSRPYDIVVIVNPNSPTGRHLLRPDLEQLLRHVHPQTRVWIDETYIEYAGEDQSLETFAASRENVVVCKSMSKVYALSGARVAYLCSAPHQLESLRPLTPPWVVSLPAQVAAVEALQDPGYYAQRYRQTALLRSDLAERLEMLDWQVIPSIANFLLCHLPSDGPSSADLVRECRCRGLFLRDPSKMGTQLGDHAIRVAVKDARTNRRMVEIIRSVLGKPEPRRALLQPTGARIPAPQAQPEKAERADGIAFSHPEDF